MAQQKLLLIVELDWTYFLQGGVLVKVIRGANSPLITTTISDELATEHKVLNGDIERTEVGGPLGVHSLFMPHLIFDFVDRTSNVSMIN